MSHCDASSYPAFVCGSLGRCWLMSLPPGAPLPGCVPMRREPGGNVSGPMTVCTSKCPVSQSSDVQVGPTMGRNPETVVSGSRLPTAVVVDLGGLIRTSHHHSPKEPEQD
eukprot:CAMPEP_0194524520 /NCGR_PEP_ID=MMETSP0253-20130528/59702_1 /TAXON_ID=2966 /ORGANISM="Noctiluca scintillans" /LENGTH=109 /DNA_ID=CAMNT_0039369149 /DNA_START=31 /DNA_END=360 /DNA_ORIENTATION=-